MLVAAVYYDPRAGCVTKKVIGIKIGKYVLHIDALWDKKKRKRLQERAAEKKRPPVPAPPDADEPPDDSDDQNVSPMQRRIREERRAREAWAAASKEPLPDGMTDVAPQEAAAKPPPRRRFTEPRRRSPTAGCFMAVLYVVFVISASVLIGGFGWISASDMLGLMKEDRVATIRINETDSIADIAVLLRDAGIIEYPWLFKLYARLASVEEKKRIAPGTYEIQIGWDYYAVVRAMRPGSPNREVVRITIPEGYTQEQIFRLLESHGVTPYETLLSAARDHEFNFDFLEDLPHTDNRLEGFLFPDTYDFYIDESPTSAITKFLRNFNRQFTTTMRTTAINMGYSIHEIITIASMIEREAVRDPERPTISSVIHNRLGSPAAYPFLEIDASVIYALGEHRTALTRADLEIDSPYNTYLYPGLPPGPIANPGIAAIRSALRPDDTRYFFYVLDLTREETGWHFFSRTLQEHNNAIARNQAARR